MHLFYIIISILAVIFLMLAILIYHVTNESRTITRLRRKVEYKALLMKEKELNAKEVSDQLSELVHISSGPEVPSPKGDPKSSEPIGFKR